MPEGTRFIQGRVIGMDKESKRLTLEDSTGLEYTLEYDVLVMAIGSIVRQAAPEQGGISLTGLEAAERIRERWHANLKLAVKETNTQGEAAADECDRRWCRHNGHRNVSRDGPRHADRGG